MRTRTFLVILCGCLISLVAQAQIRLVPLAQPRTLMEQSPRRFDPIVKLSHWQWTMPGQPKVSERQRTVGRFSVVRKYTAQGDKTLVDQYVMERPKPPTPRTPEVFKSREAYTFATMVSLIEELHVKPVDRVTLWRAAMKGLTDSLDRHSYYFTPGEFQQHVTEMSGHLVGIGAMFRTDGKLVVDRARRGSPAQLAGLRKGDHLLAVDGKPVASFEEAASLIKGKAGTRVELSVTRGGETLAIPITRAAVQINPVRMRLTKDGIAYVRLATFDGGAAKKVRKAMLGLKRKNGNSLRGLVLDLRNNPGGQLPEAVALVNDFVAPGTIVTTRGRGLEERHEADPSQVRHPTLPLVVLVNQDSASASELVTGALRDFGRATVIGTRTYGKGTMQEVIPLPDGSGLKLTTAHYHLPKGQTPHDVGIEPDISRDQARARYQARNPGKRSADYVLEQALAQLRGER